MKTSNLLDKLRSTNKTLQFQLPDRSLIQGDLHITEVKNVTIESTDCGGFTHDYQETVIQLWLNESSKKEANWSTFKASKIFDIVGKQREFLLDTEAFIEYGDSTHVTTKYTIQLEEEEDVLKISLGHTYPACKPKMLLANACC